MLIFRKNYDTYDFINLIFINMYSPFKKSNNSLFFLTLIINFIKINIYNSNNIDT